MFLWNKGVGIKMIEKISKKLYYYRGYNFKKSLIKIFYAVLIRLFFGSYPDMYNCHGQTLF